MNTRKFRTRTEFNERDNGALSGIWDIALDIGYSAVKLFSPNIVACFPAYARRVDSNFSFAGAAPANAILYKDNNTDELWLVGEVAQNTIASGDTSDSEASLYGRERYFSAMFKVLSRVGLGIGMMKNQHGEPMPSDTIVVQTGLPERYMGDERYMKEALAGSHSFSLKIADKDWVRFDFNILLQNVYVMSQPKGTLFSVCVDKDRNYTKDSIKYLKSSVIIFDPGFGTLDIFPINNGVVGGGETFSDLGMKRVLQETSKLIREEYGVDIPVPAMQKNLESGMVRFVDRRTMQSKDYPFDILLAKASRKVFEEAIERMTGVLNLADYDYLIITGGTGAAWRNYIDEKFKNFTTLTILNGNQNDDLSSVYSNVRGYYMYRNIKLRG